MFCITYGDVNGGEEELHISTDSEVKRVKG